MSTVDDSEHRPHIPPMYRSLSQPKPKGILKNAPHPQSTPAHNLQWDEENLALTEVQKDSLMKITEPKTPYVRYNAETDEIEGDIPNLDLGYRYESPPQSPILPSPTGADTSGPSSRRTSFSSAGRPSRRSASSSSSRSTSFSLPNDTKKEADATTNDEAVEEEPMDEEAQKKHAEFIKARGRHYSNEAEAMKRARELMQRDEEEEEVPGVRSTNEQKEGEDQEVIEPSEEGMDDGKPSMNGI